MSQNRSPFIQSLFEQCQKKPGILGLPESGDQRILQAAVELVSEGAFKQIVLFGSKTDALALAKDKGLDWPSDETAIIFAEDLSSDIVAKTKAHWEQYLKSRGKETSAAEIEKQATSALAQAGELLHEGLIDAVVGGAVLNTSEVIRAAIGGVGLKPNCRTVSGSFLLSRGEEPPVAFGDCAVVVQPKPSQLADIAASTAETYFKTTGIEPRIAFLSFSTKGSAKSQETEKVLEAFKIFQEKYPDYTADAELQFDAAFSAEVGQRKAPGSPVGGKANVFVFPDLDAGNIGYKIAQRLGGFEAYGPILQGLSKPFSDLSRGTTVAEIKAVAYITYLRK